MAATQQEPDPIDSMEALNAFTEDLAEQSASAETLKEQPLPSKEDKLIPPTSSMNSSKDVPYHPGSLDISADQAGAYPPNLYAPQAQAIYYGGFENPAGEWDILPQYLNVEAMEVGPTGTYNDNPSMMLAYGYTPQMPYGPYSPVTTPLPSSTGDGQLYSPQQFSYPGPYYQQPVPHSMAYMTSPAPVSQADLSIPVNTRGAFLADNLNSNSMPLGPRPSYSFPHGSVGRGSITGNSASHGFYDMRQGFDGFGSAGFWSDWLKSPEGSGSLTPLPSPSASPQPIGAIGSYGHNVTPLASGLACHQQRPLYSYGSLISSYDRGYGHGEVYHGSNFGGFIAGLGTNSRSLIAFDKVRRRGKGNASLCSCNGAFDFLNEQNRGPRATRLKNPATEQSSVESKKENSTAVPEHELYNRPEFVTEYKDAKFFIIKSYSEDNVHKSVKYGVWASTANGNKKLDAAYHEAKGKEELSPVFLFFSVNASAQFCGVAEMIGPVDFERSVDYWQQDKWSGQFPVKWHIVKDVPNNLFRHIILENNDNKPVTNSRDTQEVKLEQGLEMLNIFKTYETEMSILDDFDFYETREKAMQERKARQQQQQQQSNLMGAAVVAAAGDGHQIPVPISGDYVNQMTKTFAQVVRLEGSNTENSTAEKNDSSAAAAAAKPEDLKKTSTATETNSS